MLEAQPATVVWEATRGLGPDRPDDELTTAEALAMLDALAPFRGSTLGITGGDPLVREDLELLVTRARIRGLRVVLALGATPRVTVHRLRRLFAVAGCEEVSVRLDGASAATHDPIRGEGSYRRTLDTVQSARNVGVPVRITTTISRDNAGELEEMAAVVAMTGAAVWSVGFQTPRGGPEEDDVLDAAGHEQVLRRLASMWDTVPFRISVAKAPSFVRVMNQLHHAGGVPIPPASDGRGYMFISACGDVRPSRLLPVAGNVRAASPVDVYRDSPLFRALRDSSRLTGRCGRCEYREACGGSRSNAYVRYGDPFAEDPTCLWEPAGVVAA